MFSCTNNSMTPQTMPISDANVKNERIKVFIFISKISTQLTNTYILYKKLMKKQHLLKNLKLIYDMFYI